MKRYTFRKSRRLTHRADFAAVYEARVRQACGPLVIYARPNGLAFTRLGLSTSRKVGTAPRRNRIRRMIREAFRHLQHDLSAGYDLLIVVRAHEPLTLAEYQVLLAASASKLHAAWQRRRASPGET
jgi:ribonuclease P protein component